MAFALFGLLKTGFGDEGPGSAGFLISLLFLALGLGRLYLGLRRGPEREPGQAPPEPPPAAEVHRSGPAPSTRARRPRRRRP